MGMCASQGRLLTLTSRMSDLERRSQSISNQKMRLTQDSSDASRKYQVALNMEKIRFDNGQKTIEANAKNLTEYNPNLTTQRFLKTSDGRLVVNRTVANVFRGSSDCETFLANMGYPSSSKAPQCVYYTNMYNEMTRNGGYSETNSTIMNDSQWLYQNLKSGNIYLASKEYTEDTSTLASRYDFRSDDYNLTVESDSSYIAIAESEYTTAMSEINGKEKRLDMELSNNDTEYSSVQNEIESTKKVMDKNIESSFKLFG